MRYNASCHMIYRFKSGSKNETVYYDTLFWKKAVAFSQKIQILINPVKNSSAIALNYPVDLIVNIFV